MTEDLSPRAAALETAKANRFLTKEVGGYLRRYPDLAENERHALIHGYRQLSNVDIAIMLSNPDIAPNLQRFRAENKRETKEPFRNYAVLVILAVLSVLLVAFVLIAPK